MNEALLLDIKTRAEFRAWLIENSSVANGCFIVVKRGEPINPETFYYLDAVEEALCFGWIDSVSKPINGIVYQRFSPRKPNSPWTELNKERVRRLEKLGLMTDAGRKVLPPMGPRSFAIDQDIVVALKTARVYKTFRGFHPLYQRVRAYNVAFYKTRDTTIYEQSLKRLIEMTKKGQMYGLWNDYGRLLNY